MTDSLSVKDVKSVNINTIFDMISVEADFLDHCVSSIRVLREEKRETKRFNNNSKSR